MSDTAICPQLHLWRQIYASLAEARDEVGDRTIPMPPQVFNMQGWLLSSDTNKANRWNATVSWAQEYGFSHVIPEFSEQDWYEGNY